MSSKRILVVDDQTHINRILKRTLMQNGYEVEVATDGEQALGILRTGRFDAIVTDYQMPRMDGVTLCETYHREFPDNPVLLILSTAVADEKLQVWAKQMPNTLYLEKPVSLKRLTNIFTQYFEHTHKAAG